MKSNSKRFIFQKNTKDNYKCHFDHYSSFLVLSALFLTAVRRQAQSIKVIRLVKIIQIYLELGVTRLHLTLNRAYDVYSKTAKGMFGLGVINKGHACMMEKPLLTIKRRMA